MVPENINNKTTVFATLTLMLLPLSATSLMAIGTPNYASAQGLFEGLEREQSGESVPGAQPADTGAPAPLNSTTTVEGGSNATNANVTGAGNATNANVTGDAGTTAGNQTVGGPLALYGGGGGQ